MGKRSDFQRRPMDAYDTPAEGVTPLLPFLIAAGIERFAEPCAGKGNLVRHLEAAGLRCVFADDLATGFDALTMGEAWFGALGAQAIITNPPWSRPLLHPMINHFMRLAPTWLLFDADWCHTVQAAPYIRHCSHIISVGRLKWIEDSEHTSKDNCAWYRFHRQHVAGPAFFGRHESDDKKLRRIDPNTGPNEPGRESRSAA